MLQMKTQSSIYGMWHLERDKHRYEEKYFDEQFIYRKWPNLFWLILKTSVAEPFDFGAAPAPTFSP